MARAGREITIRRSVDDVFGLLSDAENDPKYSHLVIEAVRTSPGPIAVGTTARLVSTMFGRRITNDWVVTEFEPNRAYAWERTSAGDRLGGRMTFAEVDGGTLVKAEIVAEPRGIARFAARLIVTMGARGLERDLARLKSLMEAHTL
jgi:polyketide cyclase/dehydrase/lipid transport protein